MARSIDVHINKDTCVGCGRCVDIVPEIFEISGTTSNVKRFEEPGPDKMGSVMERIRMAVLSCPSMAIDLRQYYK